MKKITENKKTKRIIITVLIICMLLLLIAISKTTINKNNPTLIALEDDASTEIIYEPNAPMLSAGMIPVKKDGDNWVITSQDDPNWYDYSNGKPAYIMLNDGTYQSELVVDMTNKKLASDNVEVRILDDPSDTIGSIYAWIPRFCYKEEGEIKYIPSQTALGGEWVIPEMFTYKVSDETKPNFSLSGIYVGLVAPASPSATIAEMNNEDGIYEFLANNKPRQITTEDTQAIEIYNNFFGTTGGSFPTNSTDNKNIILQIVNQKLVEPIKAKIEHNKTEQRVNITVTYTKNGIAKIIDENAEGLTLNTENGITTANTGDKELEDKEYSFTVIDNAGNKMKLTVEVVTGIKAGGVTADMYGAEVRGYTCSSSGVSKWRIFYADNTNIYLISDYYVANTYLPATSSDSSSSGKTPNTSSTYKAYFTNVIGSYTGSAWIRSKQSAIANKWLTWVNTYTTSANNNIKAVAYMLDTKAWSVFAGDKAEYAIGGPTLEMYCASYKDTHPDKYIEWNSTASSSGYQVKWSTDTSFTTYVSGLNTTKEYNGIYITESSNSNASGYWLAVPNANYTDHLMGTYFDGTLEYCDLINIYYAFRPLVCLSSDVKLTEISTGIYEIQ